MGGRRSFTLPQAAGSGQRAIPPLRLLELKMSFSFAVQCVEELEKLGRLEAINDTDRANPPLAIRAQA